MDVNFSGMWLLLK